MNRFYELTPSPEESVVPRILVLVHQAVDENFPTAEKAGRQFSKTVFSDELIEKTGGDRSTSPDDILTSIGAPPLSLPNKAPASSGNIDKVASTAPPVIPPPPAAKAGKKNSASSPDTVPSPTFSNREVESDMMGRSDSLASSSPPGKGATPNRDSVKDLLEREKKGPDKTPAEDPPSKRFRANQSRLDVDWTTRITLALLLAGILLLGYVVLM